MTGLKVVMDEPYAASTTDFVPIVTRSLRRAPTCFWAVVITRTAPRSAPTLRSESRSEMGVDSGGAGRCEIRGARAGRFGHHGALTMGTAGVVYAAIWTDQRAVRREISGQVYAAPDYHAASGYAGGLVLQHAIEQAGSADPQNVLAKLNTLDPIIFFGHIRFSSDPVRHGVQIAHDMVLAQWQMVNRELGRQVVWPTAAQSADLLYPIPPAR